MPEAPTGLGSGEFDPFPFVPNCPNPEHTWIDGECHDAYIDPKSLPDYDDSLVFGSGGAGARVTIRAGGWSDRSGAVASGQQRFSRHR